MVAAAKKYGIEAFAFIVLELYNLGVIDKKSNRVLLDLEDGHLAMYIPKPAILTEATFWV